MGQCMSSAEGRQRRQDDAKAVGPATGGADEGAGAWRGAAPAPASPSGAGSSRAGTAAAEAGSVADSASGLPPTSPSSVGGGSASALARRSGGAPRGSALRTSSAGGSFTEGDGGGTTPRSGAGSRVRFSIETPRGTTGERPRTGDLAASDSVALKKIVDEFYEEVMVDPLLGPFFTKVDVPKLKSHQVKFMALAFGGKDLVVDDYPDMNLRRIHWRLIRDRGLTEAHWERFFQLFKETLAGRPEVPDATKDRAIASVATTRLYFRPIEPEEEASGVYLAPPPPPAPQLLQL